jgi:predicted N-acetyltransferase YhbS
MHQQFQEYEISDDPSRLQLDVIAAFLARSYWAATRDRDTIERSLRNSIGFGAYRDGHQVAFARVVTDAAVMFWLCDVFVAEEQRGRGLGKALTRAVLEDPRLTGLAGVLATKDAHSLYEQFGFRRDGDRLMFRLPAPIAPVHPHVAIENRSAVT